MIFGPDGRKLAEPIPEDQEGILYAELDPAMIAIAKAATDPVGHYARPDVLSLRLNRSTRNVVQVVDDEPSKQTDERDGASIAVPATVRSGNSTDSSDGGQQDV